MGYIVTTNGVYLFQGYEKPSHHDASVRIYRKYINMPSQYDKVSNMMR